MNEQDIVFRLRKRAEIRRQIPTRKSVQENKPDRIAELLDEAALEIETLRGTANKGDHVDVKIMLEKFAELIVLECVSLIRKQSIGEEILGGQRYKTVQLGETIATITEYFGVEE